MAFWEKVWHKSEEAIANILADALKCATVWLVLWLFSLLTKTLSLEGAAYDFAKLVHAWSGVGCFIVFGILLIKHLIFPYRKLGTEVEEPQEQQE